jgi:hypothetical protein
MLHRNRFGGHPADPSEGRRRRGLRGLIVLIAALVAAAAAAVVFIQPASSHGTAIGPSSRHYGCWERWGDDFQNPAMAQEDPMCWAAWQNDPSAMWNWNGLYREQVGGNHQAAIPDNQLCSGGQTGGTRYAPLDDPGAWKTTKVDSDFTFTNWDQSNCSRRRRRSSRARAARPRPATAPSSTSTSPPPVAPATTSST